MTYQNFSKSKLKFAQHLSSAIFLELPLINRSFLSLLQLYMGSRQNWEGGGGGGHPPEHDRSDGGGSKISEVLCLNHLAFIQSARPGVANLRPAGYF